MGTRSDFYMGKGNDMQWLGSIAMDGYPTGNPASILQADCLAQYLLKLGQMFGEIMASTMPHVTFPEQGWPWPWEDSQTSDYAYTFADGHVWYTIGDPARWWDARLPEPEWDEVGGERHTDPLELAVFPNMKERQNVRWDVGSGLIIVQSKIDGKPGKP